MELSIGIIVRATDQLVADALEDFLRNTFEGINVIYFTRSESKQFYVIEKDSFNKNVVRGNDK